MTEPDFGELSTDTTHYWNGPAWGWQRLWMTPESVQTAARARYGIAADSASFLASGMLNQSWHLRSADGDFVLRVVRTERSRAQITYEHALTQELHKHLDVVIPPVAGLDGETLQVWDGRPVSLFRYIDGVAGTEVASEARMPSIASILGRIHRKTSELDWPQRPGFQSIGEHPRWLWRIYQPVLRRALDPAEAGPAFELFDRTVAELDRWLNNSSRPDRLGPEAVVHGDFNNRNVLFQPNTPSPGLRAVIDWDDCCVNPLAWELAQVAFRSGEYDVQEFCNIYVDAGGPLEDRDVMLLANFATMGALSELEWTVDDGAASPRATEQVLEVAVEITDIATRASRLRAS